jgi:hypothetical protein
MKSLGTKKLGSVGGNAGDREMLGTGKESVWVWGCVGGKEKKLKC